MGIRRDEERGQERRRDGEKDKEKQPAWEDTTIVSVQALQAFLESLTAGQASASTGPPATSSAAAPPSAAPPQPQAAAAARAYQATAGSPAAPPQQAPAGAPVLTAEERSTILRLLGDLKFLSGRGVTHLTILRSDSFLQSLVDAAARARQEL